MQPRLRNLLTKEKEPEGQRRPLTVPAKHTWLGRPSAVVSHLSAGLAQRNTGQDQHLEGLVVACEREVVSTEILFGSGKIKYLAEDTVRGQETEHA